MEFCASRLTIYVNQAMLTLRCSVGPMDLDGMAFWSQSIVYQAAMVHIRLGERNDEWELDLEVLKEYLQQFEPRYKLFSNSSVSIRNFHRLITPLTGNYLRDIDVAKQAARTAC